LTISSTGHAGMEAVMTNILERGEIVLIAENGIWGQRASDMAHRQGKIQGY
jgi:alanine-glyoxylate transaminase/serine-glyoxylate transaminase/serine-pyruvate transaminase